MKLFGGCFLGGINRSRTGPAVRTWHHLRNLSEAHIKIRSHVFLWGIQGLKPSLQARVAEDILLGLQPMWLWTVASIARREGIPICRTQLEIRGTDARSGNNLLMKLFAKWSNCSVFQVLGRPGVDSSYASKQQFVFFPSRGY